MRMQEKAPGRGNASRAISNKSSNAKNSPTATGNQSALDDLATQIKTEIKAGLGHAIRAGQLLSEAKSKVPHGHWASWLKQNFYLSERTAQNLMRVAARLPNAQHAAHLSVRSALELLATPRLPDDLKDSSVSGVESYFNPGVDPEFVQQLGSPWSGEIYLIAATKKRALVELESAREILDDPHCDLAKLKWGIDQCARWERTLSMLRVLAEQRVDELAFDLVQMTGMSDKDLRAAIDDGSFRAACEARLYQLTPGSIPFTETDFRHKVLALLQEDGCSKWSDDRIAKHAEVPLWVVFECRREMGRDLVASEPLHDSVTGCSAEEYLAARGES